MLYQDDESVDMSEMVTEDFRSSNGYLTRNEPNITLHISDITQHKVNN